MGFPYRDEGKELFPLLMGQDKAKMLLGRALATGRMPHAFLLRGPEGVGKRLFARSLAATLNCRRIGGRAACGQCSPCKKFHSGNHPDFVMISPEQGTIKIDRVRELIKSLSYPPYESETRVVVLEDVHTMRREAANCLLKTLEEPPAGNLLVLTAESSKALLPTISSRCQTVPFFPLPPEDTARILQENGIDDRTAALLAGLSEGSPGRALLLWKTGMVETWEKVITMMEEASAAGDAGTGVLLQAAETMAALKENLPAFFGLLRIRIRDRLIQPSTSGDGAGDHAVGGTRSAGLFQKLRAIDRAERELARNCNRTLVCEILLFRLQETGAL